MDLLDMLNATSPIKSSSDDMGPPASHVLVTEDMDDAIITPDEGDSTTPDTDDEDLGVLDAMDEDVGATTVADVPHPDATPSGSLKAEVNDENELTLLKKQGSCDAEEQDDEDDNRSAKTDGSASNSNNTTPKDSKADDNTATAKEGKDGESNGSAKGKAPVKVGTDGKPVKKRTWKKPKDKPKRPLSAYNLFFQHEREKIVHTVSPSAASEPLDPAAILKKDLTNGGKPPKRRRHRKSHGKIGFAALARNIAEKWKCLDDSSKAVFEARAEIEKKRYKKELDEWNRLQAAKKLAAKEGAQQQALQAALAQQQKHAQQLQLQQLQQQLAAAHSRGGAAGAGGAGGPLGGGGPNDPFAPLSLAGLAGGPLDAMQDVQQQRFFGGAVGSENDHMDEYGMFGAQQQQQQAQGQDSDLSPLTLAEASLHAANHPDAAAASLDHHLLAAGTGMNGLDPISLDNLSSVLHSANAAAAYGGAGGAGNSSCMPGSSPEYQDLMSQLTATGLMSGGASGAGAGAGCLGDLDPEMSTTGATGTSADPFSAQLASLKAKAFGNAATGGSSYTSLAAAKAAAAAAAAGLKGPPLSGSASSHLAALQQQVRDSLRKQQVQTGGAGAGAPAGSAVSFLGATNSLRSLGDADNSGSTSQHQQQQQQRMAALAMQQKAALRLGAGGMLGGITGAGGEMDLAQDSEFMEFLTKLETD